MELAVRRSESLNKVPGRASLNSTYRLPRQDCFTLPSGVLSSSLLLVAINSCFEKETWVAA